MYFEKATKFCEIFTLLLSYVVPVKSKVEISQNFVFFSKYMDFIRLAKKNHCAIYLEAWIFCATAAGLSFQRIFFG